MGFFSPKVTCSICGNEVGLNRFRIAKSNGWICPSCLKLAGGSRCVNLYKMTVEDIKERIDNIDHSNSALQSPLPEKEQKIIQNNKSNVARCPKCGAEFQTGKFCSECGSPLLSTTEEQTESHPVKICPNCGDMLLPQAKKCPTCGTSVKCSGIVNL